VEPPHLLVGEAARASPWSRRAGRGKAATAAPAIVGRSPMSSASAALITPLWRREIRWPITNEVAASYAE
jgi:hypothetical protein